jgi:fibronectin-binding autotransporter adhesin
MATRFYLPDGGTSPVTAAVHGGWEQTAGWSAWPTDVTKTNTTIGTGAPRSKGSTTANNDRLDRIYISSQQLAAQTISAGTFSAVLRSVQSASTTDAWLQIMIHVVSSDGATLRGTLYAGSTATSESASAGAENQEFATTSQTRIKNAISTSSVVASAGDRIQIELGARINGTTSADTFTLRYGDETATSDWALTAGLTTNLNGWVELSNTLTWAAPAVESGNLSGSGTLSETDTPVLTAALGPNGSGTLSATSQGSPVSYTDSFTGTPGNSILGTGAGWSGDAWQFDATGTKAITTASSGNVFALLNTNTTDQHASAVATLGNSTSVGVIARYTDTNNFYLARSNGSGQLGLFSFVGGVATQLGSTPGTTFTNGQRIGIRVEGSTISLLVDNTVLVSETNTNHTSGKIGLRAVGSSTRATYDDFIGGDYSGVTEDGALSGSGTLSVGALTTTMSAELSGSGTLSATTSYALTTTGALSGSGTLSQSATPLLTQAAALSGSGTLSGTAVSLQTSSGPGTGSGTLSATGIPLAAPSAALSGSGTLSATSGNEFNLALSSEGELSAIWNQIDGVGADGEGTGTLSATTTVTLSADVDLSSSATLTETNEVELSLSGDGTLDFTVAAAITAEGYTGSGALSASTGPLWESSVSLGGSGTLTAYRPVEVRTSVLRYRTLEGSTRYRTLRGEVE